MSSSSTKQYVWKSTSGLSTAQSDSITATASGTITGAYTSQYQQTFQESGLTCGDATGTVVTVNSVLSACSALPYSVFVDTGSTVTYVYTTPVSSSVTGKQYRLGTPAPSPASGYTVSSANTVTGTYVTQWQVSFAVLPVGDGTTSPSGTAFYDAGSLPISAMANTGYAFTSWSSTGSITFLSSTSAATTATIGGPGTITANFVVATVSQPIKLTLGTAGSPVTWTISGCNANPSTILGDGNSYTITVNPSCSITISYSNAGTSRYVFSDATDSWTFTTCASDTCSAQTKTYYYQFQQTLSYSVTNGGSPTAPQFTANQFGSSYPQTLTTMATAYWFDNNAAWTETNPIPGAAGEQWFTSQPVSGTITAAATIDFSYSHQYDLQFAQSGLDSSAQGTIVTVTIGANPAVNVVFGDFTKNFGFIDAGTTIAYTFTSPVPSSNTGEQFVLTTPDASPASGFSLGSSTTVTGTYKTQYYLTVNSAYDTPGGAGWYDSGSTAYATLTSGTVSGAGTQYVFTGWSGDATGTGLTSDAITMNAAKTATANWKTQYDLQFAQSGLDSTAQGTIVTVTVDGGSPVNVAFSEFPKDFGYVDAGTTITYAFTSPVSSSTAGEQFVLTSPAPTPASGFSLSGPTTVTGAYKTQYDLQFAESSLDSSAQGTVVTVTIDGNSPVNLAFSDLTKDFGFIDASTSITYAFTSPVASSNAGEQFVLTTPVPTPASGLLVVYSYDDHGYLQDAV